MFDDGDSPAELAPDQRQRAWLASILLQSQRSWFGRFALRLRALAALRRGQRKRLERKAAVTLAGAALALSLGIGMMRAPAVYAASITVDAGVMIIADDGDCSLPEAILSANNDNAPYSSVGECADGSGADTINLPAASTFTLTSGYNIIYGSNTGLPFITTEMTIEGNGSIIERDTSVGNFRIMAVGASGDLTLNDVTVRNGSSDEDGGGLYVAGYALVTGSTLSDNTADDDGGGASAGVGGTLILDDTVVSGNDASNIGGGLSAEQGGILTVRNGSAVSYNYAADFGGGIAGSESGTVTIDDSSVDNNSAYYGGGIAGYRATFYVQNGGTITTNDADRLGGGGHFSLSDVTITDSAITTNNAYGQGGGLHLNGTETTIERSTISDNDNASLAAGFFGGGIFSGEAYDISISDVVPSYVTITDSTIDGNKGWAGGGIYNSDQSLVVISKSTLSNNEAAYGGGLANIDATFLFINSTVSGNDATENGGGVLSYGGYSPFPFANGLVLSTVTGNTAAGYGGGVLAIFGRAFAYASIISGNTATTAFNEISYSGPGSFYSGYNVLGHSGETIAQAVYDVALDVSDIVATSDGPFPTALASILNTTLANNGGPTFTHALVANSPAIDSVDTDDCVASTPLGDLSTDQRGEPRGIDIPGMGDDSGAYACDRGAYELQLNATTFCPVDPNVGYLMTDMLGTGQGSKTKGYRTRKLVVPHPENVAALYGQLAANEVGIMKYVRFLPQGYPKIQMSTPTSAAYKAYAISWWGTDLPTDVNYVKGQFFWGAKANKSPRAFVLWPTYETDEQYANVFTTFDDSTTNHVAWETGFIPTQSQTIAIPETQADGATVTVRVAVVDNDKDNRPIFLDVTVGSQTQSNTDTVPNAKDTLNLYEFTFTNVEAGVDEVVIDLESPVPDLVYLDGGDSAAMIGAAVSYQCEPETPPPAPRPDAPSNADSTTDSAAGSGFWANLRARLQQARAAQPMDAAGEYNGRFGMWWAQGEGRSAAENGRAHHWAQQDSDR